MLGRLGVSVNDLLGAELVGVLVVLLILVGQVWRRVVDATQLAFLADLDLGRHRMDARGGVVDIRDRTSRRDRLQVTVEQAVGHDRGLQLAPVVLGRNGDAALLEQAAYLLGLRLPRLFGVLVEVLAAGIGRLLEAGEALVTLDGNAVGRPDGMERDGIEVDVGEIQPFFATVENVLARQVAVQVHLPQADGVRLGVAFGDRRHRGDVAHLGDRGQTANGRFHRGAEIRRVHGLGDVERTQVAGDVLADVTIAEVVVVFGGRVDLQDLRAEIRHVDPAMDRVGTIDRVLEHQIRIAGFELQLGDGLEQLAGVDLLLANAPVGDHLFVLLGHADVAERHAVDALHVVGREQVHVLVALGQLEGDVRHHDAQRQRLDTDLLVGVFALGIEEPQDVRMVGVEIDRARALSRSQLIGVGEGVLEHLHDRDDAGGLVLDALDRGTGFAHVGERERHATAALGELQRRVDGAPDGLHVVFDA